MTNKDIEEMKRNIDELVEGLKKQEDENARLKATVKSQREKIDSLLKELEEERGKTITVSDGAITMRADIWDAINENKALKDENKSLKQQNDFLKNIFETAYIPESAESIIRKAGFSDEVIDDARKRIESLEEELKSENTALKQRIKDLEDIGNNYEPQFAPDDDISAFNYECVKQWTTEMGCKRKIQELRDQHQQDCIRYNDMRTAYLVTLDELARLREQFGIG